MISFVGFSFYSNCHEKNSSHIPTAGAVSAIALQILFVTVATILLLQGVGLLSASISFYSAAIVPEIILSTYLGCKSKKNEPIRIVEKTEIHVKQRGTLANQFVQLQRTDQPVLRNALCDRYEDVGIPTDPARIYLEDGTPTNGARAWDNYILIQGPAYPNQVEQHWRLIAEQNVTSIVRIGKADTNVRMRGVVCAPYTPTVEAPIQYPDLELKVDVPQNSVSYSVTSNITCQSYHLQFKGENREIYVYAYEEWPDHGVTTCEDVFALIQDIEKKSGNILAHCRGGVGRSGTFLVCNRIYELYKKAHAEKRFTLEIDPIALIKELRAARVGAIEESQVAMIVDFCDLLNSKLNRL